MSDCERMSVCVCPLQLRPHIFWHFSLAPSPPPFLSSGYNDELMLSAWMQSELIAEVLIHLSSTLAGKAGQPISLDRPGYSSQEQGDQVPSRV